MIEEGLVAELTTVVSTHQSRIPLLLLAGLLLVLSGAICVRAAEAERKAVNSEDLKALAARYEQQGLKAEAADTYERLIEIDPTTRPVLSRRLVKLYAELSLTRQTLAWAQVVMGSNPDPQAYLAGVHTLLGAYDEAARILENEIAREERPQRSGVLKRQLADVYEQRAKAARDTSTVPAHSDEGS